MAMMGTQVDSPGEWHWFAGYGPVALAGPCVHSCEHTRKSWIAYGPDLERYTLDECVGCLCRAWFNADGKRRGTWLAPAVATVQPSPTS